MTGRALRKHLAAPGFLLATVVVLEIAVRVWGYSDRHIYDPIYRSFPKTRDIPYIHKPNLTRVRARGLAEISTDSLGLRTKTAGDQYGPKRPGEYRIALVGDSVTFGEGVPRTEDTFAQVLEDALNQQPSTRTVKVFNFGASAYSVKEMAASLEYRMLGIDPDLVVMAIIPQDFDLTRTPAIDSSGYLVDRKPAYFAPPDSMTRRALRSLHLTYVLREIGARWFPRSVESARELSRGEVPESYRYVHHFTETARRSGIPSVIALLPRIRRIPWRSVEDRLTRDRVAHIDLSFVENEFTEAQYMASRFDPHPSPAVHHRIGQALAEYVRRTQWPAATPAASK